MSMFGALNRFISRLDAEPAQQQSNSRRGASGFQILRNENPNIPAEPWYDFIIGINSRQIDNPDAYLFSQEVKNCAGGSVTLTLWSAKVNIPSIRPFVEAVSYLQGQQIRDLHLPVPSQDARLGLTLQWTPLAATEGVWHILEVIPDSPADQAGLLPYGDYIIGTPEGIVHGESGLGELVEDFISRPLRLWVYNNEYAVTRPVTITPSRSWGGEGALGCVLGYGALHRLPPALNEPPSAPGDTLFETARFSNEESRGGSRNASNLGGSSPPLVESSSLLTPAELNAPPPMASNTTNSMKQARKTRKGVSPNRDLDNMWKESEKAMEEDNVPIKKSQPAPPPPPPKKNTPINPLPPPTEERTETASPAPIIDEDDD